MAIDLDRAGVLAHRAWAQGLHGDTDLADLDVLTLGLQDTPAGSALLGLRNRAHVETLDAPDLVLALTVRGSPHLHRRADLPLIRTALWPRDNDMLRAYLGGYGDTLIDSGEDGPRLLEVVAAEMRAAFPGETAGKGELSGAVSPRVPAIARPWCEGCGVHHVAEGLFRLATLYAGIELVPHEGRQQQFRLGPDVPDPGGDATALVELLRTAMRLTAPATLSDLVVWLDTRSVTAPPAWLRPAWEELSDELTEVRIDGATLFVHTEAVESMRNPPDPPPALLLPPRDALGLGSRTFLAPDRDLAKAVWRSIGSPGTVIIDGDIAGTWRARQAGRTLRLMVTAHRTLTAKQRKATEERTDLVAQSRGHAGRTEVTWED
jgi:hypothetical protein